MSKLNLLPEEYVKQRLQYRVDMLCVLLFGLVMVSIMTAEALSSREVQKVQMTHAQVKARYGEVEKFVNDFFVLRNDKKKLFTEAQIIAEMSDRIPRSYLLAMLTNYCPPQVTLTDITITERVIAEEVSEEDKQQRRRRRQDDEANKKKEEIKPPKIQLEIVLSGLSEGLDRIGTMFQAYKRNPLMQDVKLLMTRENRTSKGTMLEFKMVLILKETGEIMEVMQAQDQARSLALYTPMEASFDEDQDELDQIPVVEPAGQTMEAQP